MTDRENSRMTEPSDYRANNRIAVFMKKAGRRRRAFSAAVAPRRRFRIVIKDRAAVRRPKRKCTVDREPTVQSTNAARARMRSGGIFCYLGILYLLSVQCDDRYAISAGSEIIVAEEETVIRKIQSDILLCGVYGVICDSQRGGLAALRYNKRCPGRHKYIVSAVSVDKRQSAF